MEIKEYTLRNDKIEVSFINLGASITKFIDLESGKNIIVSHNDLNTYKDNLGYMNSIIGRHAGRITDFKIDNVIYHVNKNVDNLYQLHGGFNGFNTKYYTAVEKENKIIFVCTSNDGEEGYPGDVIFWITYEIKDDELHLSYAATSTKKTVMSFTNHAYFNLSGDVNNTILNHELYINADYYLTIDPDMIPVRIAKIDDTPLDFRTPKLIGQDIDSNFEQMKIAGGFDHPYLININEEINHAATLKSTESNLILDIYTNQDVLVFYSGNFMNDGFILNGGVLGKKHNALCLETQGVPNSLNINEFKDRNIYDKNEKYKQLTIWKLHK